MTKSDVTEPSVAQYLNPITLYFTATRPAFLLATLSAYLLGMLGAAYSGFNFWAETGILAGKRHLVVRLPLAQAVLIYPLLAALAFVWLVFFVYVKALPVLALLCALPLRAFWLLHQFALKPAQLLSAIKLTLAAMLNHALLLALVMLWEMQ